MTKPRPNRPPAPDHDAVARHDGKRLQKVLAHAGLGSRRQIEQWIRDGEVQINNRPARLGERWHVGDKVRVRGRPLNLDRRLGAQTRILLYHKPVGEVVTRRDPEGRPTVFEHLPKLPKGRWVTVGRLDINTEGLLLLTNDGELANRLMHPSRELAREYAVRVYGRVSDEMLEKLQRGVELEDGPARFETLEAAGGEGANTWYKVTLKEGRNRIVRRLWEAVGATVSRLIRVRYGPVVLPPGLKAGRFVELTPKEVARLEAELERA
ncbi:23S rRNA pseudouridine2605 synthase [Methylomarinovum tepidoasis]|uniref:Pseudouridine synthase n=1 Tax=Methylomarinovum tepidoasis TaxID=2840183 RepID=A0AAU9CI32_9GAMM|nr:pseudouridine synthase [Methylomarinovum sp. IN45]BCX89963.1 23S rRNA pseudouridine2605 synthase [Methylomarinovum sp. IN45]